MKDGFVKFPSTPHLVVLPGATVREDKVLTASKRLAFLDREITLEEKVDGANLGISFDSNGNLQAQNRGEYLRHPYSGQWRTLYDWLIPREDALFDALIDRYILFGEWCYARHSVSYSRLPDWFLGFDVYDRQLERFLSVAGRDAFCSKLGIVQVPVIARGRYSLTTIIDHLRGSTYTNRPAEGLYLRSDSGGLLVQRAKIVCPEFMQSVVDHWSKSAIKPNRLALSFNK
ncbi:MAG: RNA ligase family protein [Rhodobacteraceae bacterium]|nr:RNA ligase family protein [Paracoccaceae bacterium]